MTLTNLLSNPLSGAMLTYVIVNISGMLKNYVDADEGHHIHEG